MVSQNNKYRRKCQCCKCCVYSSTPDHYNDNMPLTDLIKAVFVEKPQLTILIEKQKNIYNFNRKYLYPGPSPPRRDDPMISGPLSSLPPDLESRLNAARQKTPVSSTSTSSGDNGHSPRPRPSDIMVAAVTARTNGAKTPATSQVTRRSVMRSV